MCVSVSMAGTSKHRAARQRPYDENNPPPPPPGPPPGSADRFVDDADSPSAPEGDQAQDGIYNTPYRRFSSRRRRNLRLYGSQIARDEQQDHRASGEAAGKMHRNEDKSRAEKTSEQQQESNKHLADGRTSRHRRRRSLRDARKYTPDQIIDETPGRLSPSMPIAGNAEDWHDASASDLQLERPDETVEPSRDAGDEYSDGGLWHKSAYERRE